ncbi:MAG: sigma-70 family RNA polymerase sigma factor [Streptosporangiales bacterium]|nr:sigma-70 family RNA polymerase sigma factor [Streptosporangiales bacterium]
MAAAYTEHRGALLAVAYRMLGSFRDAEDVVQEAFLRLRRALLAGERPDSQRGYLVTITTRLAIDQLRSAQHRRETYVGPWLPEPSVLDDPADAAALADSLSTAFLVLLERLSPEQRAALLLHDVFDLPYAEVASILGKSEEACRQLATRARRRVRTDQPTPTATSTTEAQQLANRFFAAAHDGNLDGLVALLAPEAEFVGDGGSSGRGVTRAIHGADAVAKTVRGIFRRIRSLSGTTQPVWVGTQPAVLILAPDGALAGVWSLVVAGDRVHAVHGMVNPAKLEHLGIPLTDLAR